MLTLPSGEKRPERPPMSPAIKVADIVVGDDALGTETLTLAGADASLFQIIAGGCRWPAWAPMRLPCGGWR